MLDLYQQLHRQTGGAVTPLIGNTLSDAGYNATYSLVPGPLQSPASWDEALDYHFPVLEIRTPVLLDFGAAGKGYLVDIVSELLEGASITTYCVDGGGDMRCRGDAALSVGMEHPSHSDEAIGIVSLQNASLCGSAGNRRAWGEYHHIISPHTLTSPRDIAAVWVVAETALLADALTTCLFFVPPETMLAYYQYSYAIVYSNGRVVRSTDFPATMFETGEA